MQWRRRRIATGLHNWTPTITCSGEELIMNGKDEEVAIPLETMQMIT